MSESIKHNMLRDQPVLIQSV